MKNSPQRGLEVFAFKPEDDEFPDLIAGKYNGGCQNSDSDNTSILKYEFLECVTKGANIHSKDYQSVPCVDLDTVNCDLTCGSGISCPSLLTVANKNASVKECSTAASPLKLLSPKDNSEPGFDSHESTKSPSGAEKKILGLIARSPEKSQLNSGLLDFPNNRAVDLASDADQNIIQRSPLHPASVIAENGGSVNNDSCSRDHSSGNMEMDDMNMNVVLYPEFIVYRDSYLTVSQLTFSQSHIKITDLNAYGDKGTFDYEWGISDLVDIEYRWFHKVEIVQIKLHIMSKDMLQDDNAHHTSAVEELKMIIIEPDWSKKREDIASLNSRYTALWSAVADSNLITGMDGDCSPGRMHYFPTFNKCFEEIVYPKGDSDAVSISRRDVDLLQPETFINDTIIDFYIKYLKNQIQPEEKHRFHFFNSFFFRKLADLDKDPSSISDGKAAFQRVRKWTRKIELFGKDYVFIPVNFNLHWSLIVMCHLGEVTRFEDDDLEKSPQVPCILHMDSIKGNHTGLKNLIQSYLWEEWKERQKETSEEVSSKFHNMRFVPLELPQQENYYDCGLFLLHYLELFLAEAPVNFNPFKITKSSNFLNVKWFPPSEASMKRTLIQRLIFELLEDRIPEASLASRQDEDQTSNFPETTQNVVGVQFLSERGNLELIQKTSSHSQAGPNLEITLLSASSTNSSQCVNGSGFVLRDLFDPGTTAGSLLGQYQSFDPKSSHYPLKGNISSIQEDLETGEHFEFVPRMTGITSQSCELPYSSSYEATYNVRIAAEAEQGDVDALHEPSVSESDDLDVGVIENSTYREDLGPCQENTNEGQSTQIEDLKCVKEGLVSFSSESLDASTVKDPQIHDKMHSSKKNSASDMSAHQDSDEAEKGIDLGNDVWMINEDIVPDSPEQQAGKKMRLTPMEDERNSIDDDSHLQLKTEL